MTLSESVEPADLECRLIRDHLPLKPAQNFTKEKLNTFRQQITKRRCPRNTTTCVLTANRTMAFALR